MLQGLIVKKIIDVVLKRVMEKSALKNMRKYVEEDNELDVKVRELEKKMVILEKMSHIPIFSKDDLKAVHKRIAKLEKK
jgi:hypothetical protein